MIEKANPRLHRNFLLCPSLDIQCQLYRDISLVCLATDGRRSDFGHVSNSGFGVDDLKHSAWSVDSARLGPRILPRERERPSLPKFFIGRVFLSCYVDYQLISLAMDEFLQTPHQRASVRRSKTRSTISIG